MPRKNKRAAVPPRPNQPRRRQLLADDQFFEDFEYWLDTDPKLARRLVRIIRETLRHPYQGIGKPEPMKHQFRGCWSRRLSEEHRVVYRVTDEFVDFLTARAHYDD